METCLELVRWLALDGGKPPLYPQQVVVISPSHTIPGHFPPSRPCKVPYCGGKLCGIIHAPATGGGRGDPHRAEDLQKEAFRRLSEKRKDFHRAGGFRPPGELRRTCRTWLTTRFCSLFTAKANKRRVTELAHRRRSRRWVAFNLAREGIL